MSANPHHRHAFGQELKEDRESFELLHNGKLEAALEEVKNRAAAADAAAAAASALDSRMRALQDQLAPGAACIGDRRLGRVC
jgi:hypothetical protein